MSAEIQFVRAMQTARKLRGWSQERVVAEVESLTGLRLNPTVVTKLEWALNPSRQHLARGLKLDEALAIAEVLGIPLAGFSPDAAARRFAEKELAWLREQREERRRQLAHFDEWVAEAERRLAELEYTPGG